MNQELMTNNQEQRIIRVFPRKTSYTPVDEMAFVGLPPLFLPKADEVHISVAFTWDIAKAKYLAAAWNNFYSIVKMGGPAFGNITQKFTPGLYIKHGVTFTTRGCNRKCPWCLVPSREGKIIEIENFAEGHIIQDNNFLQASREHKTRVFEMLSKQSKAAEFSGGLDARLVDDWFVEKLKTIRLKHLFLAADTKHALPLLEKALAKLSFLKRRKLRVYVLIGYKGESIAQATERLETVWQLGGLPFAQLYQPPTDFIAYPREWKQLARTWSRPASMFSQHNLKKTTTNFKQMSFA